MNDISPREWPINNPWTEAHDSKLKEMWGKGYTAGKIGEAIGRTRNAVIGRAHRLELPRVKGAIGISQSQRARINREKQRMARVVVVRKPKIRIVKPTPPPPPQEPASLRIPFDNRDMLRQCSWIAGEPKPDATCCGHPVNIGSSFCAFHHNRAWVKPEKRVR